MNYISHYFLDAEAGNKYFNFGLILPDMMGAAQRGWKPAPIHVNNPVANHAELARGVAAHLAADKVFHNTDFFKSGCQDLRALFEENDLIIPGIRMFFVGHIFLEMMLDRIIIRNRPEVARQFYDDIGEANEGIIMTFIQSDGVTAAEKFPLFLNRFREHKYLLNYTQNDSLFFAINRILNRAGQPAFPEEKFPEFAKVAELAEELITPKAFSFFDYLKGLRTS
jgi:hypothetical protein